MSADDFLKSLSMPEMTAVYLPLDQIEPDPEQPRKGFGAVSGAIPLQQEALQELANDIAVRGLLQPIIVREMPSGQYRIIAGERRWQAFVLNQSHSIPNSNAIPAFIRQDMTAIELRLIQLAENLQRSDLTDIEVACFLKSLLDEHPELQKQDLARMLNKNSQYISRILAIADPRWAHVVKARLIIHASVLEQFRSLPEHAQNELVQRATNENRQLTVKDIRDARTKARLLTLPTEMMTPATTSCINHGGSPAIFATGPGDSVSQEKLQVRLTLAQLNTILELGVLSDTAHLVSIMLSVEDIKRVITALGGEVPQDNHRLAPELINRINRL